MKKISASEMGKCPTCGAVIPLDSKECPECGEIFTDEVKVIKEEEVVYEEGKREKLLFWVGLVLVLLGGPGLALGSWMHDWFRVPIIGQAYDAFGPINRLFATVGMIILIIGIILLILSLRLTRTVVDEDYEVGFEGK